MSYSKQILGYPYCLMFVFHPHVMRVHLKNWKHQRMQCVEDKMVNLVLVPGFQTNGQQIENILTCLDNYYEEKSQRVEIPESSSTVQEKSL